MERVTINLPRRFGTDAPASSNITPKGPKRMSTLRFQAITRTASFVAASLLIVGLSAAIPADANVATAAGTAELAVVGTEAGAEASVAATPTNAATSQPTGEGVTAAADDGQIVYTAWYSPIFGYCWLNCWDLWFDCDCIVIEF